MRPALTALLVLAVLAQGAAQAAAAGPPQRFFGVMADGPLFGPDVSLDGELRLMRSTGLGSIRAAFDWRLGEPTPGRYEFTLSDIAVAAAARRNLTMLPTVLWAPEWARRDSGQQASPPRPRPYARYVAQLARRYGTRGSFWREHPRLRRLPIRDWQIWNEPTVENFWTIQPWQRDYAKLLRVTRRALLEADPDARVVAAGLVYDSWNALERLYRAGARGQFDVLALHPFTNRPSNVLRIIRNARRVMDRHGDREVPIFLTEVSWPSSLDKIGWRYGFETTEQGMAKRIRSAYPRIVRARHKLRIRRAYWYTWLTRERDPEYPFDYAGLRRLDEDGRVVSKPGLAALRQTIAALRR